MKEQETDETGEILKTDVLGRVRANPERLGVNFQILIVWDHQIDIG